MVFPIWSSQYNELHIDMVRTHDFMGPTEIDSLFANDDPMLTWLVPDTEQRAGLVAEPEMRASSFLTGALTGKGGELSLRANRQSDSAIRGTGAEVYYRIGRSFGSKPGPPRISTSLRTS